MGLERDAAGWGFRRGRRSRGPVTPVRGWCDAGDAGFRRGTASGHQVPIQLGTRPARRLGRVLFLLLRILGLEQNHEQRPVDMGILRAVGVDVCRVRMVVMVMVPMPVSVSLGLVR
jgi:hypothetical protein